MAWPSRRPPGGGHGYGLETVCLFLRLVLVANVSLRGASRVLAMLGEALGVPLAVPCWTTGRIRAFFIKQWRPDIRQCRT